MSHYIELVKFDSPVNLKIFKNINCQIKLDNSSLHM